MKPYEKKILYILLIMFLFMIVNAFFWHSLKYVNLNYIIFYLVFLGLSFLILGYKKDHFIYKIDSIQITFIYIFIYFLIIYLAGFFLGFEKNPYSLELIKIFKNITPIVIIIFTQELFRYNILKKTQNKYIIGLLYIVFICFDISLNIEFYSITTHLDIFELIGLLIIPSLIKNILFIYLSFKGSIWPIIIYRLLFELYVYFIPVTPSLGVYIESILNVIFPTIVFLRFNALFSKKRIVYNKKRKLISSLVFLPTIFILITLIGLSSNLFSHSIISIGSNSMYPKIKKGDAVLIEKIKNNLDTIKIGDILVYTNDNKIIVHRVIKIRKTKGKYIFKTKGDNNNTIDNYEIKENMIIGKVNLIIPYIGYPSVWLSEIINN